MRVRVLCERVSRRWGSPEDRRTGSVSQRVAAAGITRFQLVRAAHHIGTHEHFKK